MKSPLRVAIVHDYLTQRGGAERVVLAMVKAFPNARIITALYEPTGTFDEFKNYHIETSALQRVRIFRTDPRWALPVLPSIFGRMRVRDVDLVLCSTSGWAHGAGTDAPKLVYCHNPPRWIYQPRDYLDNQSLLVRLVFRPYSRYLKAWDLRAAHSATKYLTTSTSVRARIRAAYSLDADLLPPPVALDPTGIQQEVRGLDPGYFLIVGRFHEYKNVGTVCEAFTDMPDQRLVLVGKLPPRSGGRAWPKNIQAMSEIPDSSLRWLYANCHAVVSTSREDFGLTPLEGNAFGRPALVLRAGGFTDTVIEGVSGHFIDENSSPAVVAGVRTMLQMRFDETRILEHAAHYAERSFVAALHREVHSLVGGVGTELA